MKPLILAAAAAALMLSGCAGIKTPVPPNVQVVVADSGTVVDGLYNVAGKAYKAALPGLTPVQKAQIKPLFAQLFTCPKGATSGAQCKGYVAAADQAAAAGDAANLAQMTEAAQALIGQIGNILPK